jgi:hypothetical protein
MMQSHRLSRRGIPFQLGWYRVEVGQGQLVLFGALFLFLLAVGLAQPLVTASILCVAATVIAVNVIYSGIQMAIDAMPAFFFSRLGRIRTWKIRFIALAALTLSFNKAQSAHAQFFNSLETRLKEVIAGANTGIDEAIITNIFIFFRVLVVLAFVTGVIICLTLAMRQADWQPILNVMGIGVAFVVGVEIISQLMLGGGEGGGQAPQGGAGGN